MPEFQCNKENAFYMTYFILLVLRWVFLLIAIVLFIIGTSNSSQIAFLVFAFIDILLVVLFVAAFIKQNKIVMIVFLISTLVLTVIHIITTSCAIAFRPTDGSEKSSIYLAGAIMGLIGALITIPGGVFLFLSKGDEPWGEF